MCEEHGCTYEWANGQRPGRRSWVDINFWQQFSSCTSLPGLINLIKVRQQSEVTVRHQETGAIHQKSQTRGITYRTSEVLTPAHISHDSDSERPRKHSISTHFPKDRNCEVCLCEPKMTRSSCGRRTGEEVLRAEKFGDLTTADHKVCNEEGESETITDVQSRCKI